MTEQGPFRPAQDGNLRPNPYAWNQVANMVFIESPAGVGFSYAENTDDYTTGDSQTAIDNYNTIQAFMKRFPEYSANDLYITSESYGTSTLFFESIMNN
jgi:carboxypeptidase C (cathepsin A)